MPIDHNLLASMGAGGANAHRAGLESRLIQDRLAQDETTRNALAGYLESQPEERDARLNALVAQSPDMAANVLTIEHARADRAQGERRRVATEALSELKAIRSSANPGLAFRLMAERPDEGNPLRGLMAQLQQAGAINLDDGISDEEAAQIADIAMVQLAPVAGAQDVERADPADVRAMELLGYEMTPEGFAKYNADKGAGEVTIADQLGAIQTKLQIEQRQEELRREREADERATEERRVKRVQVRTGLRRGVEQTGELANLTEQLRGTFLEAGMPASTWRRTAASVLAGTGAALGMDTKKLEGDIATFDRLKKGLSDQLINLMSSGDLSNQTNALLQQYQNALATTETSPPAIMAIQGNIAQTLLDEADAQGVEIFDRKKVEANIKKWHEYEQEQGEPVIDAPALARSVGDIAKMTATQLEEYGATAGDLTDEMLDAAAKRWDELNAGR